jgi:hypothetical protein
MIVSNQGSNNVSVLRNASSAGNLLLDTHVDYNVDPDPFFIAIADLDEDQKPDIVSSNSNVYTISILKNAITTGPAPTINSFAPASGITGTQVKIKGSNFTNVTAVDFGGVAASSFTVDSATGITAIVGNGASGSVRVTASFGIATLPGFTYTGPVINSFAPLSGVTGTTVKIRGTNLTSATIVKFGGAMASSFTVDSSTGITAIVGAGASGAVTVTTPGGTASLPGFIYSVPTVTSFAPASGPVGTAVTISGSHFDPTPSKNTVYFGAVKATVSAGTDSILIVKVPVGTTYQPISVTANNVTGYSSKPFVTTFKGGEDSFTLSSFIPKLDASTGNYPHSIGSGDFDGDGKIDLLVSKGSDSGAVILANTGSPGNVSFAPKPSFPGTGNHEGCVVGDIDGDGKLDFAIVNGISSSTVSVYRNTSTVGNISFAPKIDYATGNAPYSIAIGDLNGDGRPELVVANSSLDSVSIYSNISKPGNILFDTKLSFYVGTNPYGVAIGDLDGDGKPDLAVTTQGTSLSLSVIRNTSTGGSISFSSKTDLATLNGPFIVSIGDLDGDGKLDLAAASSNSNAVTVVRNASSPGNISFKSRNDLATGNYPVGVSITDLDGDGKPDLVTSNRFSNNISIIKNKSTIGSFSFANHVDYPVNTDPLYVVAADVDGDGRPDLLAANSATDVISILQNIIGGKVAPSITSFTPTSGINGTTVKITGSNFTNITSVSFGGVAASSFTVDSTTGITAVVGPGASGDVSVTNSYGTATHAGFIFNGPIINSFTPTFGEGGTVVTITGVNFTGVSAVKFGGTPASSFTVDSSTGITAVVGTASTGDVTVTTPKGTASLAGFSFGLPTITSFTPASGHIGTIVTITGTHFDTAALNNIVFFGAVRATVSSATSTKLIVTVPAGATYQPITVTVNHRTAFSLLPFLVTFDNHGDEISTSSFSVVGNFPVGTYPFDIAISDFNNDGKPDLVIVNGVSNNISVLKNISTGTTISFADKIDFDAGPDAGRAAISDLDGDGKPDIAIANFNSGHQGSISILRNTSANGDISFSSQNGYPTGDGPNGIAINDMDGDGKPDIVIVTGNSAIVSIFKNTTSSQELSVLHRGRTTHCSMATM